MIARGFKPVGWVAAVAGAALGCYMLSLNVAAERAELAKIERQIVIAKQDIRSLQTELGTRGRLQQLEHWNAEVLALSAPTAAQFLENEMTLARFETKVPTIADRAKVRMAAAETPAPAPALAPADYAAAAARNAAEPKPLVHQASYVAPSRQPLVRKAAAIKAVEPLAVARIDKPAKKAAERKAEAPVVKLARAIKPARLKKEAAPSSSTGMLDALLLRELGETARSEQSGAGAGAR